jgi:hypothetical protein
MFLQLMSVHYWILLKLNVCPIIDQHFHFYTTVCNVKDSKLVNLLIYLYIYTNLECVFAYRSMYA